MITCCFLHQKDESCIGFSFKGHAYSGVRGGDLVCASVTTLAQTCITGLKDVVGLPLSIHHEVDGELIVQIAGVVSNRDRLRVSDLFAVIESGLEYIIASSKKYSSSNDKSQAPIIIIHRYVDLKGD